ncbi:MAG: redoxin family protein [Pirellulales bacterium]
MLRKFRKVRKWWVLAGAGVWALAGGVPAWAAKPTPQAALELAPVQKDVQYERPTKEQIDKCVVEALNEDGVSGWVVRDGSGQTLRRFADTNKDNKLDRWSYYREGIEVYRDIDANYNGKADEYRWLGTAGIRWGLDENEDGKIDRWKAISPEEVTAEVVAALRERDEQRFRRLLLTDEEVDTLGLPATQTEDLKRRLEAARSGFADLARKQKQVTDKTVWTNFGATQPGVLPAGTGGSTKDLIVYENVAAVVETGDKHTQIAVGTLIQVGTHWRLFDLPGNLLDEKTASASAGYFFSVYNSALNRPMAAEASGELQKLTEELEALEAKIAQANAPDALAELNGRRADLLEKLFQSAKTDEERATWVRQLADTISAAVQSGSYPQGVARLEQIAEQLREQQAKPEFVAYVQFRVLLARYSQEIAEADADPAKVQQHWIESLEGFVKDYPGVPDAADAMLQLAIAQEFANKTEQALEWYERIVREFADTEVSRKAAGAKLRLESVGRSIPLKGKALDGRPVDLASLKGYTVLVHYWATWCEPCKQDMVKLKDLQAKYAKQKFVVIGVNLDNDRAEAAAYVRSARVAWLQLHEPGGLESRFATELGIFTLPSMLLIDANGKVANRGIHAAELDAELGKIFRDPSSPVRGTAGKDGKAARK